MLVNPVAQPLFWPTIQIVGGLLVAILVLIVAVERRPWPELVARPLFQRWRTWLVIAGIYSLAVLAGSLPTALLVLGISLQCLREYSALAGLPCGYRRVLLGMGALAAPAALFSDDLFHALPPLLLVLATLQPLLLGDARSGVRHLAFAAFGWGYLAWLLSFMVILHRYVEGGVSLLLVIGLAVAMSDVAAFTVGRRLGRRPLAPTLSPNKTWEGVGGNLLGALVGVALMSFAWLPLFAWPVAVGLGVLIGLGAVWGDLIESAVKRASGVKDAGTWLPGFGGLLDRVDSFIIVLPLVYYAALLMQWGARLG